MCCVAEQPLDLGHNRIDAVVDDVPHNLQIDAHVAMNQYIAHAGHTGPRNVGVLLAECGRQGFGGLADNFEIRITAS